MSTEDEKEGGWGKPALLAVLLLLLFIIIRFGGWMIYGIQTAGLKRDITIAIENGTEEEPSQANVGFFVDIDKKMIVMEINDYSTGNKNPLMKMLNSHEKKVIRKASISDEDVDLLLSLTLPDYVPKTKKDKVREEYLKDMQKLTLEYNTDRVRDYYATVTVYRYDIEQVLDRLDDPYVEFDEEAGE